MVAPTGVDPVTSRFSVGLNNELQSRALQLTRNSKVVRSPVGQLRGQIVGN